MVGAQFSTKSRVYEIQFCGCPIFYKRQSHPVCLSLCLPMNAKITGSKNTILLCSLSSWIRGKEVNLYSITCPTIDSLVSCPLSLNRVSLKFNLIFRVAPRCLAMMRAKYEGTENTPGYIIPVYIRSLL